MTNGEQLKFLCPKEYGCQQLNSKCVHAHKGDESCWRSGEGFITQDLSMTGYPQLSGIISVLKNFHEL